MSLKALVNFKNWSESSYNRSIKPYYYKVKDGSYLPDTDEYELQLLQTGDQYLSQSGISRNSDQTFYFDARLDWKRSFGDHNLSAMLMYMMREYRNDVLPNRNQGYSGRLTYDLPISICWNLTLVIMVLNVWQKVSVSNSFQLLLWDGSSARKVLGAN